MIPSPNYAKKLGIIGDFGLQNEFLLITGITTKVIDFYQVAENSLKRY
jgi:hypothetical protein